MAEIGVLLLLLTLGLEYTADELRHGLRTGLVPGVDRCRRSTSCPGFAAGLLLGLGPDGGGAARWGVLGELVGHRAKVLNDLGRLANRETPSILNLLVIEDLAMAVYLPVAAALVAGQDAGRDGRPPWRWPSWRWP